MISKENLEMLEELNINPHKERWRIASMALQTIMKDRKMLIEACITAGITDNDQQQ